MAIAAQEMTGEEIAQELGTTESAVKRACAALNIEAKRDLADMRRKVYPIGTLERVRTWLEAHR